MSKQYSALPNNLIEDGFVNDAGMLSDAAYQQVVEAMPIVCVDALPVLNIAGRYKFGAIIRATGQEVGKLALIGGRVRHGENLFEALCRHSLETLGINKLEILKENSTEQPFYVAQYQHMQQSKGLFDPSKHSIGLTYLVKYLDDKFLPTGEASGFEWITSEEIPECMAFNQQIIYRQAAALLSGLS